MASVAGGLGIVRLGGKLSSGLCAVWQPLSMAKIPATTHDPRYTVLSVFSDRPTRRVEECHDVVRGQRVVLKSNAIRSAWIREAAVLLELCASTAPRLLDLIWDGERITLVMERLPGVTLAEAVPSIDPDQVASWARALAVALGRLHAAGYAHTDLKPSNVWVLAATSGDDDLSPRDRPAGAEDRLRFLDLASPWRLSSPFEEDEALDTREVTPPYAAPELMRGWLIDPRSDLFSLGVLLEECFPTVALDSRWAPILRRLVATSPSARFPDARTLRKSIEDVFCLEPWKDRPLFRGGVLRERDSLRAEILGPVKKATDSARVLIRGNPGTGLTRLALELVLEMARCEGPPMRTLDISRTERPRVEQRAARDFLEAAISTGYSVVVAVSDPSPSLAWPGGPAPEWIRNDFTEAARTPSMLTDTTVPPISSAAVSEIFADCLGLGGERLEDLASLAVREGEGDLHKCERFFDYVLARDAVESNDGWALSKAPDPGAVEKHSWAGEVGLTLASFPGAQQRVLALVARTEDGTSRSILLRLLQEFGSGEEDPSRVLTHLESLGLLVPEDKSAESGLRFGSLRLRREAEAHELQGVDAVELERWLFDHLPVDASAGPSVFAACRRARTLEETDRERQLYAAALQYAMEGRRWRLLADLLRYPGETTEPWTVDLLQSRVSRAVGMAACDANTLKIAVAEGFSKYDVEVGEAYLSSLMDATDPPLRANALHLAADRDVTFGDGSRAAQIADLLEEENLLDFLPTGAFGLLRARIAHSRGERDTAIELARRVVASSPSEERIERSLGLQLLGVLVADTEPSSALAHFREASEAAPDEGTRAQMNFNTALLYRSILNDLPAALEAVEQAREVYARTGNRMMQVRCRMLRASTVASLLPPRQALVELRSCLDTFELRQDASRRGALRSLQSSVLRSLGDQTSAVRLAAAAWADVREGSSRKIRNDVTTILIDCLQEAQAWSVVNEYVAASAPLSTDLYEPWTVARFDALLAESAGRVDDAWAILQDGIEEVQTTAPKAALGDYLYHAASVVQRTQQFDRAERALRYLEEARKLPSLGWFPYNRLRADLTYAEALWDAGDCQAAIETLRDVIEAARRTDARGLLARSLGLRALWSDRLGSDRSGEGS